MLPGEGGAGGDEVGGCALEDDPAAVVARAGAEVNDPVSVRHDRLVVLDDDDRLAGVDEPVEQAKQMLDVGEVQAGGWFVEDVDPALLGHVGGQLKPLPVPLAPSQSPRSCRSEVLVEQASKPVAALHTPGRERDHLCRLAGSALLQPLVRPGVEVVLDELGCGVSPC